MWRYSLKYFFMRLINLPLIHVIRKTDLFLWGHNVELCWGVISKKKYLSLLAALADKSTKYIKFVFANPAVIDDNFF